MAKPSRDGSGSGRTAFYAAGICVGLVALTGAVFGQTLHYPFINYDDQQYVVEIPQVTSGLTSAGLAWAFTHIHGGNWHPLTTISHMLDCQFYGLKAGGHHFTNVLLHSAVALALFLALWQMTGVVAGVGPSRRSGTKADDPGAAVTDRGYRSPATMWRAAFVAAVFAIHPLRVESVAWIAERKDVLSGLFFILTLGAYVRYVRKPSIGRNLLVVLFFGLGLMCKPMIVTLPLILLLLDFWPLHRFSRATRCQVILEKLPLFGLSLISCGVTLFAQQGAIIPEETLPFGARISNAIVSYVAYLGQFVWPLRLGVFYPHAGSSLTNSKILLAAILLLMITIATVVWRRKYPYLLTGWLWYLIMLVPVIGLVQVGLQARADRYTYLPEIGILLVLTWLVSELTAGWSWQRPILGISATAIIVGLTLQARAQTSYWRDSESLWTHTISVTLNNDVAHAYLADLYLRRGEVEQGMSHAKAAVQMRPNNIDARNNLALALLRTGDANAAVMNWKQCLALNHHHKNAESNLAWVLATCPQQTVRDGPRAVALVQDALGRGGTRNAMVLRTLGAAYAESGRFQEALDVAHEALQLAIAQGNSALADDLRLNIANYQQNLPLRDPSLANVQP